VHLLDKERVLSESDRSRPYRGSRRHILEWVERPTFAAELTAFCARCLSRCLLRTCGCLEARPRQRRRAWTRLAEGRCHIRSAGLYYGTGGSHTQAELILRTGISPSAVASRISPASCWSRARPMCRNSVPPEKLAQPRSRRDQGITISSANGIAVSTSTGTGRTFTARSSARRVVV
jgi:hypothetical protein